MTGEYDMITVNKSSVVSLVERKPQKTKKTTTPIFIEYFLIHLKPEFLLWTRNWIHLSKKEVEKKRYVSLTDGFLIIIGTYINK